MHKSPWVSKHQKSWPYFVANVYSKTKIYFQWKNKSNIENNAQPSHIHVIHKPVISLSVLQILVFWWYNLYTFIREMCDAQKESLSEKHLQSQNSQKLGVTCTHQGWCNTPVSHLYTRIILSHKYEELKRGMWDREGWKQSTTQIDHKINIIYRHHSNQRDLSYLIWTMKMTWRS